MEAVAYVRFTDGVMRPVYEDERGQFVVDADECRIRGLWYLPRDEYDPPTVVLGPGRE